ncbi:hypothetical protein [Parvimonas sp. G1425]|uniref:hypothetical protein n=1 Tax=Parvimonas sp. G1425 TaxID=3387694 RepID=UPI0039E66466
MKKENPSTILFLLGTIIELILLLYVKSFKTGQGIHLPNYLFYLGFFFPQLIGAVGAYFSRYSKKVGLWLFLNLSLIISTLYFFVSYLEVID